MTVEAKTREKQKVTTDSGSSSGGGGMMGFDALGGAMHDDSIQSMEYFQQLGADIYDRNRQEKLDAYSAEMERKKMAQQNRLQNMAGLDFLAGQRQNAQVTANRRPSFRDALANSLRGA